MEQILFPSQYKKAILNRTKTLTVRSKNERGRYQKGKTYLAKSYAGRAWNRKIKIIAIFPTTLNKLREFGIPESSVQAMQKRDGLTCNEKVELIRFKVL